MAPSVLRTAALTALTLVAFAANSLLCRAALAGHSIDATSFTTLRLLSGALVLAVLVRAQRRDRRAGSWASALALFVYALGFSWGYVSLPTGTGALLLFGAVQATMIGGGIAAGERPSAFEVVGGLTASAGLVYLVLPGLTAPPPLAAASMRVRRGAPSRGALSSRAMPACARRAGPSSARR